MWYETAAFMRYSPNSFPVEDVLVSAGSRSYMWSPEQGTPLPGSYLLAHLTSASSNFAVSLRELGDSEVARGALDVTGEQVASLLCQTGVQCVARVSFDARAVASHLEPFQIDLREASPELDTRSTAFGAIDDLILYQGRIIIVGPWGLRVLDPGSLTQVGSLGGWAVNGANGVGRCGSHLCVSRAGFQGLAVVSVSDPTSPQVMGSMFTAGLGWDVASWGSRAYVAHGLLGVGIYDVSNPTAPRFVDVLHMGGIVRSVAIRGSLLAVGMLGGEIRLYELENGPTLRGSVLAEGPLIKLRFRGPRLWALKWPGHHVGVFDVSDVENVVRLGQIGHISREEFFARYFGPMRYTLDGPRVSRYRLVPLVP
jgi:hypothetical protein